MLRYCLPSAIIFQLLALCHCLIIIQFALSQPVSLPECPSTCGNLTIPYPFGIGTSCAREGFDLNCNHTFTPPRAYFGDGSEIEWLSTSLLDGQVRVRYSLSSNCYSEDGSDLTNSSTLYRLGDSSPYAFSRTHNMFTAIGCDTMAFISPLNSGWFTGICVSMCDRPDQLVNGSCSGIGCCQTAIPKGLKNYVVHLGSFDNHTKVWDFNPCSYAFLVDKDWFTFKVEDITGNSVYRSTADRVPVVLDWVAGNQTCAEAGRENQTYACRSEHSECYDSSGSATGYICNCSSGYEGNPYLVGGCQGILVGVSCILGVLFLIICVVVIQKKLRKMRMKKNRQRNFKENYDILLQRQLLCSKYDNIAERIRFFSLKDMEKATNKFDNSRIVGTGGHGTVYKGLLELQLVAIKRANVDTKFETEQSINEVILLSHVSHRNVVKFLGCCFETEVPLLVYEFVSNGTLFDLLHNLNEECQLSWDDRVRISMEISSALSYMHTAANVSIYHRDIKSSNILLDDRYIVKISDFGASRTVAAEQTHVSTCVQGTIGYLDPEYIHTGQLTEKSDVYSLGVILVELLTGKKASSRSGEDDRNLLSYFIRATESNNLAHIVDPSILEDSDKMELETVANLAVASLSIRGKDRPTMKVIEQTLEKMSGRKKRVPKESIYGKQLENNFFLLETSPGASITSMSMNNSEEGDT